MADQFRGKTWIYRAQVIGCGGLGVFSVVEGILFGMSIQTDANGEARPQVAILLLIAAAILLPVTVLASFNIVARRRPIIRCFRDGIECNLVGATAIDDAPMVPAWFQDAQVTGPPMARVLVLTGTATNVRTAASTDIICFKQFMLKTNLDIISLELSRFFRDPAARDNLSSWES